MTVNKRKVGGALCLATAWLLLSSMVGLASRSEGHGFWTGFLGLQLGFAILIPIVALFLLGAHLLDE